MNTAEEDALIAQIQAEGVRTEPHAYAASPLLRLAIRAAYARGVEAEREREMTLFDAAIADDGKTIWPGEVDILREQLFGTAAAIRRGES